MGGGQAQESASHRHWLHYLAKSAKMHFMDESAKAGEPIEARSASGKDPSRREVRKQQTRATLTRLARKFTAEHGLQNFTLDELCEAANISRRTFFNHFASKDDAVLGFPKASPFTPHIDAFLGSTGHTSLPEALTKLLADSIEDASGDVDPTVLMDLVHREPGLVNRLRQNGVDAVEEIERLICTRERLDFPNDYAHTVSFVLHHMTMFALGPAPVSSTRPTPPAHLTSDFRTAFGTQLQHMQKFFESTPPNICETPQPTPTTTEPVDTNAT